MQEQGRNNPPSRIIVEVRGLDTVPDLGETLMGVLGEVAGERQRQFRKWGQQDHDDVRVWVSILAEEQGEVATEANDYMLAFDGALQRMRAECVQVAAVAVAIVQAIDRMPAEAAPDPMLCTEPTVGTNP